MLMEVVEVMGSADESRIVLDYRTHLVERLGTSLNM